MKTIDGIRHRWIVCRDCGKGIYIPLLSAKLCPECRKMHEELRHQKMFGIKKKPISI